MCVLAEFSLLSLLFMQTISLWDGTAYIQGVPFPSVNLPWKCRGRRDLLILAILNPTKMTIKITCHTQPVADRPVHSILHCVAAFLSAG